MFLSKAFLMSELNIYQIFKLNYYKKIQEWWTVDVDGDFISFNLHKNTENSIILLKRWRGDYKKEYCQIYQHCFYLEELTQIEWSISEKQNKRRAYEQKLEIRNLNSITVLNLIQIQNPDLSEYLLIVYPNLTDFRLFILQYKKRIFW